MSKSRVAVNIVAYCRFLSMTFITSNAASSAIETLKLFKEGLNIKLDSNVGQSVGQFSYRVCVSCGLLIKIMTAAFHVRLYMTTAFTDPQHQSPSLLFSRTKTISSSFRGVKKRQKIPTTTFRQVSKPIQCFMVSRLRPSDASGTIHNELHCFRT